MFKEQQSLFCTRFSGYYGHAQTYWETVLQTSSSEYFFKDLLAFLCEPNDIRLKIKKKTLSAPRHDEKVFIYLFFIIVDVNCFSNVVSIGSWSLQFEGAGQVCVLRSLLWPGLKLYHVLMTPQHGYIYIGNGTKNLDLPFML